MGIAPDVISAMVDRQEPAIEILGIGIGPEIIEGCARAIKANGRPAHANYASSPDAVEQILRERDIHVILCHTPKSSIVLTNLVTTLNESKSDAVVVAVGGDSKVLSSPAVRDWLPDADDKHLHWVVSREYSDLMARRELRRSRLRLKETEHRCDALMESSKEAIAYVHDGMHIRANAVYLDLFDVSDEDTMEGLPLMDLIEKKFRAPLKKTLSVTHFDGKGPLNLQAECRTLSGGNFAAQLELAPASIDGEPCIQIIVRRDTDSEEVERLRKLANRDPHTGLYHRNYFVAGVEAAMPHLYTDPDIEYSVIYCAIDNFHELRNEHGLDIAEQVLRETAEVLESLKPDDALIARFGDYSFAMLVKTGAAEGEGPTDLAEKLRSTLSSHAFKSVQVFLAVTLSIGIARSRRSRMQSAQEFVNFAYKAFNEARTDGGGNCILEYSPGADDSTDPSADDAALIEMVDFAIAHKSFSLTYQPLLATKQQQHDHYEVHLYLRDVDDRDLPSSVFLGPAQKARRLLEIDRWLISKCLEQHRKPTRSGRPLHFHLPLSAAGLSDRRLVSWLRETLENRRAQPGQFTLVLDDGDVRTNLQQARLFVTALSRLGCSVMISGIGKSEEDIKLVKHLPGLSGVRIDDAFASKSPDGEDMLSDDFHEKNAEFQQLGLETVVTHASHADDVATLWGVGVDYIEGEFLSGPLSGPVFDFSQY